MNNRIKELWEQSKTLGVHPKFGEYDKYSAEKFAELIVRECAKLVEDNMDPQNAWITPGVIKEHFGVEE